MVANFQLGFSAHSVRAWPILGFCKPQTEESREKTCKRKLTITGGHCCVNGFLFDVLERSFFRRHVFINVAKAPPTHHAHKGGVLSTERRFEEIRRLGDAQWWEAQVEKKRLRIFHEKENKISYWKESIERDSPKSLLSHDSLNQVISLRSGRFRRKSPRDTHTHPRITFRIMRQSLPKIKIQGKLEQI